MAEHLQQNEEELGKLLAEYWRLRHQTGNLDKLDIDNNSFRGVISEVYMETLANKLGLDLAEVNIA